MKRETMQEFIERMNLEIDEVFAERDRALAARPVEVQQRALSTAQPGKFLGYSYDEEGNIDGAIYEL